MIYSFMRLGFITFWCLLGSLVVALSAEAQLFSDDVAREATKKNTADIQKIRALVRDLNDAVNQINKQNPNFRKQLTGLLQKYQSLDERFRYLSGQVEELQQSYNASISKDNRAQEIKLSSLQKGLETAHQTITVTRNQIQASIDALEKRLEIIEGRQKLSLQSEDEMYVNAFRKFQKKQYSESINEFSRVMQVYPEGQFNASAQYWLGQAHLLNENYDMALESARLLIEKYPTSDKLPEAHLVVAKALLGMGSVEEGHNELQLLLEKFPTSLAADQARQLIAQ